MYNNAIMLEGPRFGTDRGKLCLLKYQSKWQKALVTQMKLVAIYEYQTNKLTHQQIGTEEAIAQIFEILVSSQTT